MKIAIGYDPNAMDCARKLAHALREEGYDVTDMGGEDVIYANTAQKVANAIKSGMCDRGILICGTGIGMSIAANKVQGVYAALISDCYSAERARKSNNAQIACFGAFTLGYLLIEKLTHIFLSNEFDPASASSIKVKRIAEMDASK